MKESYERDLHHAWMILEIEQMYEEDYQMRMIMENTIPGFLMTCGQGEDEKSRYRYEISGKISMKSQGEKERWKAHDIENFMRQFIQVIYEAGKYLLDVNCISLDPSHIYIQDGIFYFCYCPVLPGSIQENFHILTEYFVREVDYEDKAGIYLAYELHKASMEENYNIERILEGILERKEKELELLRTKKEESAYDLQEEILLDDWVAGQEMRGYVLQDRQTIWGFVSRKMKKRKEKKEKLWEENG